MISRRAILTHGAASIVVLGSGITACGPGLGQAREPWSQAGTGYDDVRLDALSYAILAPSPHNRQPWLVQLDGDDGLTVYADLSRLLPETDPPNRQIVIGLGAFLEMLRQAAAQMGYVAETSPFPEGEPEPLLDQRPVARVTFVPSGEVVRDPLFAQALSRRTIRTPFDQKKPMPVSALEQIGSALTAQMTGFDYALDMERLDALKRICREGWAIEIGTSRTHKESTALTRIGAAEINENPDGISLSGPFIETMKTVGVLTRENMNDPQSRAFRETQVFYDKAINTAMAFGWLTTADNTRRSQLQAGADWLRLHLAATEAGVAMQPLSQALQEFPEMAEKYAELHALLQVDAPARIQGLFRFGYASAPEPAPRWPMQTRLIKD
ncbi:MAG: hypothetical protein MRY72_06650 [Aquisalinus sp.]|nr:hypothetical protein [Aquisalinus sp.]